MNTDKIINFPRNREKTKLEIKNQTSDSVDLYLYAEIGFWGITAADMASTLKNITAARINLHVNSPGGDVFDGVAIYNMLVAHSAKVHVYVDGLAASIASLISMAGDEINIASNAMLMVHNAWTIVAGDAEVLRQQADLLDQINQTLVSTYVARTGMKEAEIKALLDAETWLTADDAKAKGFATAITEAKKVAASFDLSIFDKAPAALTEPRQEEFHPASVGEKVSPAAAIRRRRLALLE